MCIFTYIHMYIPYIKTNIEYMHTYIHTDIHTDKADGLADIYSDRPRDRKIYMRRQTDRQACTYKHIYIHTCIQTYIIYKLRSHYYSFISDKFIRFAFSIEKKPKQHFLF